MSRNQQLVMSLGTAIAGGLLCGLGAASTQTHAANTTCIVLGLALSVFGFISLVLVWKKSGRSDN